MLVSLVTDPGAAVGVSWVERGDTAFTVHLTGAVAQETVFGWFLVEPL